MIPEIDLQLHVVIRALREVVAEAIDPKNPTAQEQLRTSISLLELLAARRRLENARARQELTNAIAMAEAVARVQANSELLKAIEKARQAALQQDADRQDLARKDLAASISHVVNTAQSSELRRALGIVVVQHSKLVLELARAWYAPAGFETGVDNLAALDDLLGNSGNDDAN